MWDTKITLYSFVAMYVCLSEQCVNMYNYCILAQGDFNRCDNDGNCTDDRVCIAFGESARRDCSEPSMYTNTYVHITACVAM